MLFATITSGFLLLAVSYFALLCLFETSLLVRDAVLAVVKRDK